MTGLTCSQAAQDRPLSPAQARQSKNKGFTINIHGRYRGGKTKPNLSKSK